MSTKSSKTAAKTPSTGKVVPISANVKSAAQVAKPVQNVEAVATPVEAALSQVNEIPLTSEQADRMRVAIDTLQQAKLIYADFALQERRAIEDLAVAQQRMNQILQDVGGQHGLGDPANGKWLLAMDRMVFMRQS